MKVNCWLAFISALSAVWLLAASLECKKVFPIAAPFTNNSLS